MNRLILPVVLLSAVSSFTTNRLNQITSPARTSDVNSISPLPSHSRNYHIPNTSFHRTTSIQSTNSNDESLTLTSNDLHHLKLATTVARIGLGNTYPNPAVGCILLRNNNTIIGSGFHPRAGMPHAEVFALLEAHGHVHDGVEAAKSVMDRSTTTTIANPLTKRVLELLNVYKSNDGASKLFSGKFDDDNKNDHITAYVTLEPCCHVGQTPPCALSLVAAGVHRVVVGYRDPNPRVDGGGIQLLKEAGVEVYVVDADSDNVEEKEAAVDCAELVKYFVKRISPGNGFSEDMYGTMNGKKKRVLRAMASRQKTDGNMASVQWIPDGALSIDEKNIDILHDINIDAKFLEEVDRSLFDNELVLLKLNGIVKKKKVAKIIGERVAEILNAHVAQVLGHTALLYRPGVPPVLDLDELIRKEVDE